MGLFKKINDDLVDEKLAIKSRDEIVAAMIKKGYSPDVALSFANQSIYGRVILEVQFIVGEALDLPL